MTRRQKKGRKENTRSVRFPRILIITEGEKTEVAYFQSIKRLMDQKYHEQLIVEKVDLEIEGAGQSTSKLIPIAEKLRLKNEYLEVWLVFDKDRFTDFDVAIRNAESKNMKVAWSNISFELWFLLHFEEVTAPLSNQILTQKLKNHVADYSKSQSLTYMNLEQYVDLAITRAIRANERFESHIIFSERNPSTRVVELVSMLKRYL
ncbi:RloB family protein [Chryseomicrobium palamuruense]|uniref:RloB family protein n=1 Tax=Chryseomicrobium palamuruense TaxID=682973 RepID=A0ABV8US94_9BACL